MKRIMPFLLPALLWFTALPAQNIRLGERIPEMRSASWLDSRRPAQAPLTLIEFYSTTHDAKQSTLARLEALARKYGTKLRVIVITREEASLAARRLGAFVARNANAGVVVDGARYFDSFGVVYLPFTVLTDARNRTLWMGTDSSAEEEIKRNIPTQ